MSASPAPRTLIWGAGAIGGTLGAYLARAGRDVTLVDTVADHVETIARDGLRITGPIDTFTVHVPAYTPATLRGTTSARSAVANDYIYLLAL